MRYNDWLNVGFWVCQVLLAILFGYSGLMKSIKTKRELVEMGQTAAEDLSPETIRFIGIMEILGTIGIILPCLTGIFPILTPLAAVGFGIIMILAAVFHFRRGEKTIVLLNLFLLLLCAFVAYGRFINLSK